MWFNGRTNDRLVGGWGSGFVQDKSDAAAPQDTSDGGWHGLRGVCRDTGVPGLGGVSQSARTQGCGHGAARPGQPNNIAKPEKVKVIRPSPLDNERHEMEMDVDKMIRAGNTRLNILLEPGDVVFVRPPPLAWLGLKVRELLFPAEPVDEAYTTPLAFQAAQSYYQDNDVAGARPRR